MKVLVAPAGPGSEPDDFCFTVPGELVTIPVECEADEGCGCGRSWVGLFTRKATTVAVVTDPDMTAADYLEVVADHDLGWKLLRIAHHFDVGDIVERFGPTIEVR